MSRLPANYPNNEASAPAPTHWAHIQESTCVGGIWVLYWIYRLLGRWPFRFCLYPVVSYYWLTRRQARLASLQYLQRHHRYFLRPGTKPGVRDSYRHLLAFADVLLDKVLAGSGRYPVHDVAIEGAELIKRHIDSGRGAVVVTSHTGCVELSQTLAQDRPGLKLTILVHTQHAPRFNKLMKRLSSDAAVEFVQVTDFDIGTAMKLAERVRNGGLIAIAGDRIPVIGARICSAEFLGHSANLPTGPYVLAAVLKCPLFFLGCVRHGNSYRITIKELASVVRLPKNQRNEALSHYARQYTHALEEMLRDAPLDWYNFFWFWEQGRNQLAPPEMYQAPHEFTTSN